MILYDTGPKVTNEALNDLFADAWPGHTRRDFSYILSRSLGYVCATTAEGLLVGFVNVEWGRNRGCE
jgi:hypothetical protein